MRYASRTFWDNALPEPPVRSPFVHVKVPKIFGDAEYSKLLGLWPDAENFEPFSKTGRVPKGPSDARRVFVLGGSAHAQLPEKTREYWRQFHDQVAGPTAKESLINKLQTYLAASDLQRVRSSGFEIDVLLLSDDSWVRFKAAHRCTL